MRIAITGGAGYVGCRLSKYLLDQGHTIDCIDWLTWGIEPILNIIDHSNFNLHRIDICTPGVEPILRNADAVIHLAGIVGFPSCNAQPDLAYKVNVDGTQRVINASTDKIFVYASTGSVYGEIGDICTETVEPNPISSYSVYKLQGEQMLNGTDAVILRPATAFGVSNRLRNDLLVNDFVRKACLGEDMVLFEGHFKRTFISINDLVRGFAMSIERFDDMKGQVWNIGDENLNHTKLEICEIIKKHIPSWNFKGNDTLQHDQDGRNYFVDYTKIRQFGYTASEDLDHGIQNLIRVYKSLQ
jgi:nucleoside-diphosphate-sugar epimerase|tara:strand:- start:7245 stop:8144 length:900 start_codon:yes stop_codon:yes gene_type:complete